MTSDTSQWPEQARRLLAWINARRLTPEQDYPGGYDGVGSRRDLTDLVARLCPDPEAHEPRGEPARQPCDEGTPGSTPHGLTSTQALDPHPDYDGINCPSCGTMDCNCAELQEPDEPEWVRVAPSITEALSALQSLYYAQMIREALRERAELLRRLKALKAQADESRLAGAAAVDKMNEVIRERDALQEDYSSLNKECLGQRQRISNLESTESSQLTEARAEVERLRAELSSVRADFLASQRG